MTLHQVLSQESNDEVQGDMVVMVEEGESQHTERYEDHSSSENVFDSDREERRYPLREREPKDFSNFKLYHTISAVKPKKTKVNKRRNVDGWICPPNMISLGNRCYLFSETEATWDESHFECRKSGSKLAIVRNRSQDHNLRRFLNGYIEKHDRWIGAIYDWKNGKWRWGSNSQPLKYTGFNADIKKRSMKDLVWNSIFMDPKLDNQWNADKRTAKKRFICQVKAKAVKRLDITRSKPQAVIKIIDNSNRNQGAS
ncbi:hypothetical protein JTB14_022025 [Gonioctena quinquepunctata]|nr:hypothetical protein JTB14_022025 [Gonioctena quinquepunctata]